MYQTWMAMPGRANPLGPAGVSPEMPTVPHLRDKLRRIRLGRPIDELDRAEIAKADRWIEEHFVFIDADPTGREDEDFDLDWLLDRATDAVLRDAIRCL